MVRTSISPGPLEGASVFDAQNKRVGVVEDIEVSGQHITSFRVALDPGITGKRRGASDHVSIARDWITSTDGERLDLVMSLDELLQRVKE